MFDKLEGLVDRLDTVLQELNDPDVAGNQNRFRDLMKEQNELTPIVEKYKEYKAEKQNIEDSLMLLEEESDEEMKELAKEEPSVIISRRPCALLKYVKHNPPLKVNKDKCVGCKQCLKIGCPAISIHDGKCVIEHTQCVGCGICKEMCKLGAICD